VTSGPFHLVAWKERDRVELVRSPTYWDRGAVRVERFTALSIDDQAASTNLYFTGACDATASNVIPSTYLPAINGEQRGGRAYKDYDVSPFLTVYFAWIQTRKLTTATFAVRCRSRSIAAQCRGSPTAARSRPRS